MHGLRHRISGFLTISALAVVAAVAAATLGISPAQAHTPTAVLTPNGAGADTAWAGTSASVSETGTPDCGSGSNSLISSTAGQRESVTIPLTSVPNDAVITSVDVQAYQRGNGSTGGTFQTYTRLDGTLLDSGSPITASVDSGCNLATQTINVADVVKSGTTTLEIGVLKGNATGVRVGALRAIVTYNIGPSAPTLSTPADAATTQDRTPTFDWNEDSVDPNDGTGGPSGVLLPTANGFHTQWSGEVDRIDEAATPPSCSSSDFIDENTTGRRESVVIDLASVPTGATITSIDVQAYHRGDGAAGGTFQTFTRLNSTDLDSGTNIAAVGVNDGACTLNTQTLNVPDTVKAAGTTLQIGVIKTAGNTNKVRIGALRAVVNYSAPPAAETPFTYEINLAPFVASACDWGNGTIDAVSSSTFTPASNMDFGVHCWRVRALDHADLAGPWSNHRTITIEANDVTAAITAADKDYDGTTDADYTCEVVGADPSDDVTCDGTHPGTFDNATAGTDKTVTAADLVLGGADAGTYNLTNTTDTDEANIAKVELSVDADGKSKDYGAAEPTYTYTLTGFVNGEDALTAAITGAGECDREAGETVAGSPYEITCTPGTLAADNYTFATGEPGELTINKATLSVDADDASKDFGDADPTFTYTLSGFATGEDKDSAGVTGDAACDREPGETVADSPYDITCAPGTLAADNYDFETGATGQLTIEAADVTAEITATNKVYDGTTDAEYTCEVSGAQTGDDVTCDGAHPGSFEDANVGTDKTVTATDLALGGDDAGSYTLTNTTDIDEADITKASLSVDADDQSKAFGAADPTFTYTLSGFATGEDEESAGVTGDANCTRDAGNSVAGSPYDITCAPGTLAAANYDFETGSTGELTIGKADPVCTISAFEGTYDGNAHGATGTCEGVDGEGELAGLDLGATFTNVPGGTAEWTFTDETGNYNDDFGSVGVVILPATLSVDADDQSKNFGEADPTLTSTLSGFVNGEDAESAGVTGEAACEREEGESVAGSPYTITCLPGTLEADNYTFVAGATGQLTIGAGDVTAEITAADKPYDGTTDAQYTCEVVGADPDDEVSCDGEPGLFDDATAGTDKTVTANGLTLSGEDAGNYNLTNTNDTDTADITKVPLSVDADDKTKAFGEDDPTLTYTLTGFVNDEDALSAGIDGAGECTRDEGESVAGSPYDITCTAGTLAADNYTFETGATGQLTIGTATLSVDADDQPKAFGDPDPDLTYTLSGFPEGEDEETAGVTGEAACEREEGESVAGSPYTITCTPGTLTADNYTFETGATGELTIGSADVSAEITATDKEYDGTTEAAYTCDVVGEVDGDDVTCSGTQPGVFESAGAGTGKTVTASDLVLGGEDAGSYTLTNTSDTDTADITKATLSVDADDKSKEVGEDDPELTYTLTGFKNGETALTAAGLSGAGDCTREAGDTVADSPYTITCTPDTLEADNYDFETGATGELTINPDSSAPSVTINQGSTQDDPTTESPIVFDVEFSESVTGFEDGDVDLSGTAGATTANVTGSGTDYEVAVSGMTGGGTVIADVPAGAATDGTNVSTASTSDDNTVTFEELVFDPGPTATISGSPTVGSTLTAGEGSPSPAPDSYEYQWYADGNEIDGATNKTFKPTTTHVGKVITVKVTAIKDGYTDASDTSAPTPAITGGSVPEPHGNLLVPVSDSRVEASCTFSVRGVVGNRVSAKFTTKVKEKKATTFAKATVAKITMSCIAQPEGFPESAAFGTTFSNNGWVMYRTRYLRGPIATSYQLCGDLKYTLKDGTEHTVENCSS